MKRNDGKMENITTEAATVDTVADKTAGTGNKDINNNKNIDNNKDINSNKGVSSSKGVNSQENSLIKTKKKKKKRKHPLLFRYWLFFFLSCV